MRRRLLTSLLPRCELRREPSATVERTLDELLAHLQVWIGRWEKGGFAALSAAWESHCASLGQYVAVGGHTGVVLGFGSAGQLLLREDDGTRREVWTGEVA